MIRLTIMKTDAAAVPPVRPVQAPLDQQIGRPHHAESTKGVLAAKGIGQALR